MQLGGGAHVRSERGRGAVPQCSVQHRANEYIEIASGALCSNSEKGSASTMIYRQLGLRWVQQGRADQSTVRYLGPQ